jgi:hypothetical protein
MRWIHAGWDIDVAAAAVTIFEGAGGAGYGCLGEGF